MGSTISSADGGKFKTIAQRRTVDILLGYAIADLDLIARRYAIERLPESLNLVAIDRDMGDERLSVRIVKGRDGASRIIVPGARQ